jgi:hypothetical protein
MLLLRGLACVALVCSTAAGATISGVILPPGRAKKIQAFERQGAKLFKILNRTHDGTIDAKTGEFTIPGLPNGTYQLLITCDNLKIEGVDLHVDDEEDEATFAYCFQTGKVDVERLDLSDFFDPDEVVSEERKSKIVRKLMGIDKLRQKLASLTKVDRFCDHLRPLVAHGTKRDVFVLVEKARLRDFYAGGGQAIYRVEIWPFRKAGAVWDKPNKGVRVLQRHRFTAKAALTGFGAMFEPSLGGLQILKGRSVTGIRYTIPQKWDGSRGKIPGTPVRKWKADTE